MRIAMTLVAAAAALAVPPTLAAQQPTMPAVVDGTLLELSVRGEVTRVPDLAIISAGVETRAATAGEALSQNSVRMRQVLDALEASGVERRDIRTDRISLNPQYDYRNDEAPRLTGYVASNSVSVRFREIERAGSIIDALVESGANQVNGPNFMLSDPDAAMDEARLDALRVGRERAEAYAGALGKRLVRLVSVSESGASRPQPIVVAGARASMDSVAAAPPAPIEPGEQDVGITLSMLYELN